MKKRACLSFMLCGAVLLALWSQGVQAQRGLPDFSDVIEKTAPAVVNIRTTEKIQLDNLSGLPEIDESHPLYEFFRRILPPGQRLPRPGPEGNPGEGEQEVQHGIGSGFIISTDGYLLTNHHVVEGATEMLVTLPDKREFRARLVGSDQLTDVALLKIEATGLPHLPLGDPGKTRVGEWVLAIGSPLGLDNSVTAGIVSAKARDTGEYLRFIQTDVAVNQGNSGGPLLNLRGEVIGINSRLISLSGGYMGISLAIPIDDVMRVVEQLRSSGKVTRGLLGVSIGPVTRDMAEGVNLPKHLGTGSGLSATALGAFVSRVHPASPAEKAGIKPGDIVVRFDGKLIERASYLPRLVGNTAPGTKASVQVWSQGALRTLTVTVGEMGAEKMGSRSDPVRSKRQAANNPLGLAVVEIASERRGELRLKEGGVQVEAVDGLGARLGVRPGDIILALNNAQITSARQFEQLVARLEPGRLVGLMVQRGEVVQLLTFRLGK